MKNVASTTVIIEVLSPTHGPMNILIDLADYETVSKHTWTVRKTGNHFYAVSRIDGKGVYMHRLLTNCPDKLVVNHKNENGLDNRRVNIEIVSNRYNIVYSRESKGASFSRKKHYARIRMPDQKQVYLGTCSSKEQAMYLYAEAVKIIEHATIDELKRLKYELSIAKEKE